MKTLPPNTRLMNRRQLRQAVPASDMTIWRWEQAGIFPHHIDINGRNYWIASEVDAWVRKRAIRRDST